MKPFDDAHLEALAKWFDAGVSVYRSPQVKKLHVGAAQGIRNAIKVHTEVSQRVVDLSTENHLLHYELGKFRKALQHARDTRPNENYLTVSLDVSAVDALLGGSKR
jgi:hypothetical protein